MSEDVGRKTLRSPFFFNDCRHSRPSSILFFFFVCLNDFDRPEKTSLMLQRAQRTKYTKKKKKTTCHSCRHGCLSMREYLLLQRWTITSDTPGRSVVDIVVSTFYSFFTFLGCPASNLFVCLFYSWCSLSQALGLCRIAAFLRGRVV